MNWFARSHPRSLVHLSPLRLFCCTALLSLCISAVSGVLLAYIHAWPHLRTLDDKTVVTSLSDLAVAMPEDLRISFDRNGSVSMNRALPYSLTLVEAPGRSSRVVFEPRGETQALMKKYSSEVADSADSADWVVSGSNLLVLDRSKTTTMATTTTAPKSRKLRYVLSSMSDAFVEVGLSVFCEPITRNDLVDSIEHERALKQQIRDGGRLRAAEARKQLLGLEYYNESAMEATAAAKGFNNVVSFRLVMFAARAMGVVPMDQGDDDVEPEQLTTTYVCTRRTVAVACRELQRNFLLHMHPRVLFGLSSYILSIVRLLECVSFLGFALLYAPVLCYCVLRCLGGRRGPPPVFSHLVKIAVYVALAEITIVYVCMPLLSVFLPVLYYSTMLADQLQNDEVLLLVHAVLVFIVSVRFYDPPVFWGPGPAVLLHVQFVPPVDPAAQVGVVRAAPAAAAAEGRARAAAEPAGSGPRGLAAQPLPRALVAAEEAREGEGSEDDSRGVSSRSSAASVDAPVTDAAAPFMWPPMHPLSVALSQQQQLCPLSTSALRIPALLQQPVDPAGMALFVAQALQAQIHMTRLQLAHIERLLQLHSYCIGQVAARAIGHDGESYN